MDSLSALHSRIMKSFTTHLLRAYSFSDVSSFGQEKGIQFLETIFEITFSGFANYSFLLSCGFWVSFILFSFFFQNRVSDDKLFPSKSHDFSMIFTKASEIYWYVADKC